nr:hypothetical protein CFP56_77889 [Quercus suber]
MVIVVGWYITFEFLAAFQCPGHFDADWTGGSIKYCWLNYTWNMGLTLSNFLLDIIVLLFPIPPVSTREMARLRKLSPTLMTPGFETQRKHGKKTLNSRRVFSRFRVSTLALDSTDQRADFDGRASGLGASVARLIVYVENFHGHSHLFSSSDVYLTEIELVYIQMLESGISITAINLPSLWHLCTVTVPAQVSRGMRRLCGLRAELDPADFTASETSVSVPPPMVSVPEKAFGAPWWARLSDRACRLERAGQNCEVARQLSGEMFLHELNSIRVQKDIEVRHE